MCPLQPGASANEQDGPNSGDWFNSHKNRVRPHHYDLLEEVQDSSRNAGEVGNTDVGVAQYLV